MSNKGLYRGPGPLKLVAGRYWAEKLESRRMAGFAGWYYAGSGLKRDDPNDPHDPNDPRVTLMSRTFLPSHLSAI
ncbi:hypothetical protein Bca4012_078870 [Brassica carinata]